MSALFAVGGLGYDMVVKRSAAISIMSVSIEDNTDDLPHLRDAFRRQVVTNLDGCIP